MNNKKWIPSEGKEPENFEKIKKKYFYIWITDTKGKIKLLRSKDHIEWSDITQYMPKLN